MGTIGRQTWLPANTQSNGPLGVTPLVPSFGPSEIKYEATDRTVTQTPRPPSHQDNSRLESVASRTQEVTSDTGYSVDVPGPTIGWRGNDLKRLGLPDIGTGPTQESEVSNGLRSYLTSRLTYPDLNFERDHPCSVLGILRIRQPIG